MEETRKSSIVRDLIIKIFLILLFVFLITILFPMPNLTAFYDSVFNNNVQSMKDAADSYFTKERMPEKVGDSVKLTLQQMLDKKLILPFLDKDGNECDANKSYVKVTKGEKEYTLEVHLSCPNKEDYIIEPIGCYNFCPEQTVNCSCSCVQEEKPTTDDNGKVTVNKPQTTPSNDKPSNNDKYKLQYLYTRTITDVKWNTGNYQENKEKETDNVRLVDTKKQYTGQKKVSNGSTLYKHIKYAYKDNWQIETDWTDEVKSTSDTYKLYAIRTLYTGYKPYVVETTKYKHIKYAYKDNYTDTDWTTEKKSESSSVKVIDKRYTVRKTVQTTKGTWSDWVKEGVWRDSKPADTSTKQWYGPYNTQTTSSWKTIYNSISYPTRQQPISGNRKYEFLYADRDQCTDTCNGDSSVMRYYYRVYELQESKQYMYYYRTYSSSTSTSTDEKVVSDPTPYTNSGYTIVKTEYRYRINNGEKYIADTTWTDSKESPAGYVYANEKKITRTTKYESIGKWVTNKERLGEYTHYVTTRKQYKYKKNIPEKYIESTIWTNSINSPKGYTYTGEHKTTSSTSYVDLGKWVDSESELGDYTHNVKTRILYKYKYRTVTTKTESRWFDKNPGGDWVYANQTRKVKVN